MPWHFVHNILQQSGLDMISQCTWAQFKKSNIFKSTDINNYHFFKLGLISWCVPVACSFYFVSCELCESFSIIVNSSNHIINRKWDVSIYSPTMSWQFIMGLALYFRCLCVEKASLQNITATKFSWHFYMLYLPFFRKPWKFRSAS